jgi:hypothetical protein
MADRRIFALSFIWHGSCWARADRERAKEPEMRGLEILCGLSWLAVATMLPLAALEPVEVSAAVQATG